MNDNSEGFDRLVDLLGTPPLVTVVRVNTLKTTVHDARHSLVCSVVLQTTLTQKIHKKFGFQPNAKILAEFFLIQYKDFIK